jgi:hypothetical protein
MARFVPPTTLKSPRRRKKASSFRFAVTDRRNDAEPMVDAIARHYGRTSDRLLVDTSYAPGEDIVALAHHVAGPVSI